MMPETGRRFGPYEILGRLGGGGMGHIFRAWDARLHREVAIKLLHSEFAMPGMRERFLREARAASALNHPNICTIFDIGEQDGDPYLVMELLQGETLKDRILNRTIQVDDLLSVARDVAEALGAAHAKGVIHRDIKPANIFLVLKPNGGTQAKVLDFGLAKMEGGVVGARGNRSLDITTVGATVGTLAYMSPEQARGEVLDSRSDLFSLGVVLYEMATRQIPFPGATSALVFVKLLNEAPEPVRDWNDAIPRDLEKIIQKLMAKERTARFQTARELAAALERFAEKGSGGGWLRKAVATVPLVRAPDPVARDRRPPRRRSTDSHGEAAPASEGPPSRGASSLGSSSANQLLRPVARVPRPDATPPPLVSSSSRSPAPTPPGLDIPRRRLEDRRESREAANVAESGSKPAERPPTQEPPSKIIAPAVAENRSATPESRPSLFVAADPSGIETAIRNAQLRDSPYLSARREGNAAAPGEIFAAPGDPLPAGAAAKRIKPVSLAGGVVLLLVLGTAAALVLNRGHLGPTLLTDQDTIVLTEIENRTGNKALDGTVAEGLGIALAQSPYLRLRSEKSYLAARLGASGKPDGNGGPQAARILAQRLGARAYLYGSVRGASPPYLLHVDLLDTTSNDVLTSAEEQAASLQQMPRAIDRVADDLRSSIGEDGDSITRGHNPLGREGTANIEALHAFREGEVALSTGKMMDALRFYQQAVSVEPRFIQPQLRLAALYRAQGAEVAAAETAKAALAAADGASERTRTLAEYEYEMNTSLDFVRAAGVIRHLLTLYPHDSLALEDLARALRLQGRYPEALQVAQEAYGEDPYVLGAYGQAEYAMIGLDRFANAFALAQQVQRLGVGPKGAMLIPAYLAGRQDSVDSAIAELGLDRPGYRSHRAYGLYLDSIGSLAQGAALWRRDADAAQHGKGLESASGLLLAQAALDRALLGECADALAFAHESDNQPQGAVALFESGVANALCGDTPRAQQIMTELTRTYPQGYAVNGFYLPDIKAAIALHDNNPSAALDALDPARQYDLISMTPYLRGLANIALHQVEIGIVDFQTVLSHPGVDFTTGSVVLPAAQIGVARAFAQTGDTRGSADAYRKFVELWHNADATQPLLVEARSHAR